MDRTNRLTAFLFLCTFLLLSSGLFAQAWKPYGFRGGEHFKYDVTSTTDGETKAGHFTLDIEKAGEDQFKVSYQSVLGEDEASSTTTSTADELPGKIMMSLLMSGNEAGAILGATVFTPVLGMMFMGTSDLEIGSGWSRTEEGKKMSFKIEDKETVGGQEGYRCVFKENDEVKYLQVISPDIGLPLRTVVIDDDGSRHESKLVEYSK
jgi:hypothetical protein